MPNHVMNILVVTGAAASITSMLEKIKSDENPIDFDKILPMPKELVEVTSPVRIVSQEEYDKRSESDFTKPITKAISDDYKKRFGADNWYDWALKNWGTKWGSYEASVEIEENGETSTFEFQTAWSSGASAIIHLSKQYPDLNFKLSFADEDAGSNVGIYHLSDGKVIKNETPIDDKTAMELYFECWGIEPGEAGYVEVDGTWKFEED